MVAKPRKSRKARKARKAKEESNLVILGLLSFSLPQAAASSVAFLAIRSVAFLAIRTAWNVVLAAAKKSKSSLHQNL